IFWIPTTLLLAQPLLVGMSRLRLPLTHFLLIAVAALLTSSASPRERALAKLAGLAMIALFFIDHRSTLLVLSQAWQQK
ncbi:MAG: hypothetical protein MK291_11370, partial [Planctomycetes bacterium]|nr:hypothetical protein [Planctomycetota bacterium]